MYEVLLRIEGHIVSAEVRGCEHTIAQASNAEGVLGVHLQRIVVATHAALRTGSRRHCLKKPGQLLLDLHPQAW